MRCVSEKREEASSQFVIILLPEEHAIRKKTGLVDFYHFSKMLSQNNLKLTIYRNDIVFTELSCARQSDFVLLGSSPKAASQEILFRDSLFCLRFDKILLDLF